MRPALLLVVALAACERRSAPPVEIPASAPGSIVVTTGDVPPPPPLPTPPAPASTSSPVVPVQGPDGCSQVVVALGQTADVVPIQDVRAYAASPSGVVDVHRTTSALRVTGNAAGSATLRVQHKDGHETKYCLRVGP
jgi:hypothetical protein